MPPILTKALNHFQKFFIMEIFIHTHPKFNVFGNILSNINSRICVIFYSFLFALRKFKVEVKSIIEHTKAIPSSSEQVMIIPDITNQGSPFQVIGHMPTVRADSLMFRSNHTFFNCRALKRICT